ncbi:hypothetical protein AEGHOMDF_5861 [Methylobacterium soli]|nr:hypothetical protein AEGHOMDF_5861 [Methylobacterium soli]
MPVRMSQGVSAPTASANGFLSTKHMCKVVKAPSACGDCVSRIPRMTRLAQSTAMLSHQRLRSIFLRSFFDNVSQILAFTSSFISGTSHSSSSTRRPILSTTKPSPTMTALRLALSRVFRPMSTRNGSSASTSSSNRTRDGQATTGRSLDARPVFRASMSALSRSYRLDLGGAFSPAYSTALLTIRSYASTASFSPKLPDQRYPSRSIVGSCSPSSNFKTQRRSCRPHGGLRMNSPIPARGFRGLASGFGGRALGDLRCGATRAQSSFDTVLLISTAASSMSVGLRVKHPCFSSCRNSLQNSHFHITFGRSRSGMSNRRTTSLCKSAFALDCENQSRS